MTEPGSARAKQPSGRERSVLSPEARFAGEVLAALVLAAVAVWGATRWIAIPFSIAGESMAPTLEPGDRVLVDLTAYARRDPERGDVALVVGPGGAPLVKRVGERVRAPGSEAGPFFLVLGDNPGRSLDSRTFGPVSCDRFRGRIVWRFWPPSRMGRVR